MDFEGTINLYIESDADGDFYNGHDLEEKDFKKIGRLWSRKSYGIPMGYRS